MLHFDSHPDLACPNPSIPAKACFFPRETFLVATDSAKKNNIKEEKNLYELLDSTSAGIAEWILPLVVAANLRRVHWVKPPAANNRSEQKSAVELSLFPPPPSQLPVGIHTYQIGVACDAQTLAENKITTISELPSSAAIKVDWPHPYYLEDNSTVGYGKNDNKTTQDTTEELLFSQGLDLQVSSLSNNHEEASELKKMLASEQQSTIDDHDKKSIWALDICLDYFACQNPFLTDLEAMDATFTRALIEAVYKTRFYGSEIMATTPTEARACSPEQLASLHHYHWNLVQFRQFLVQQLREQLQRQEQEQEGEVELLKENYEELGDYYEDPREGEIYLRRLMEAFYCLPPMQKENLISMVEQALPNLTMPHTSTEAITMENTQPALQRVQEELEHRYKQSSYAKEDIVTSSYATTPFIITVARSSIDGFTSKEVADGLQDTVLQHLHGIYCGCPNRIDTSNISTTHQCETPLKARTAKGCKFRIIFDHDETEGSSFD
jgi:hypothetical protein